MAVARPPAPENGPDTRERRPRLDRPGCRFRGHVCESLTHEPPGKHPARGRARGGPQRHLRRRGSAGALAQLRTVAATAKIQVTSTIADLQNLPTGDLKSAFERSSACKSVAAST